MNPGRLASEHASADQSPGLLLWQVTNRWQAAQRAVLKAHELTHVQFVLLASLAWLESDGPVTQRQLADHAASDEMMTSQVVRVLEQRGLIRRGTHPQDKRARALNVTAAGRELAAAANEVVEACDREFFGVLGARSSAFADALRAVLPAVEQGPADR